MKVVALKDIDLRPDMASIDGDRAVIEQTAAYVKGLWSQMKTAEVYIAAGREFKNAHGHLSKNSKHDRNRIGWQKAFSKTENKFDCDRRLAEHYITIYDTFFHVGNVFPTWKLPQSLRALLALATLKLTSDQFKVAIDGGTITPHSSEADIRHLGRQLGIGTKKKAKRTKTQPLPMMPSDTAPKRERIAAAFDLLARLKLTVDDLEKEFVR